MRGIADRFAAALCQLSMVTISSFITDFQLLFNFDPDYCQLTIDVHSTMIIRHTILLVAFLFSLPSAVAGCVQCTNEPTAGMISKSRNCTVELVSKGIKCIDRETWVRDGYCQLSCYEAGRGYEGIVCCQAGSPVPSPTAPPAIVPPTGKSISWNHIQAGEDF